MRAEQNHQHFLPTKTVGIHGNVSRKHVDRCMMRSQQDQDFTQEIREDAALEVML
jgi:hypothetical protein